MTPTEPRPKPTPPKLTSPVLNAPKRSRAVSAGVGGLLLGAGPVQ